MEVPPGQGASILLEQQYSIMERDFDCSDMQILGKAAERIYSRTLYPHCVPCIFVEDPGRRRLLHGHGRMSHLRKT